MTAVILTEGSKHIGFGHITRCMALYQALEAKGISPLLIVNGDETVRPLLDGKNNLVFDWLTETERIVAQLRQANIAIIDSYLAPQAFYEQASSTVNTAVFIDDTIRIAYPKGIIVNGTIGAEKLNYIKRDDSLYLLGSEYIPLRQAFWDMPQRIARPTIESVLITFGGDDIRNVTPKIIRWLQAQFPTLKRTVIIGGAFQHREEIEALKTPIDTFLYMPDAETMKRAMMESDIAISAAGQTLYELARTGTPTIAITVAENQLNNVRGWQENGFIENAGWWNDKQIPVNLINAINKISSEIEREKRIKTGQDVIDGKGAKRIVQAATKNYIEAVICIRAANIDDMMNVYTLSTDVDVRKNSFNSAEILLDSHRTWFFEKLKDTNCLYYITEIDRVFAGQIRIEVDEHHAVVGISISERFRSSGAGNIMMENVLRKAKEQKPQLQHVYAYIKPENIASVKYFEKCGYKFSKKTTVNQQEAFEYIYYY